MKKKLLLVMIVAVSSFLLSACDPIDALTGWRENFFTQPSSAQIIASFGWLVIILATGVLVLGLVGAKSIERIGWGQAISVPLLLFIALILTLLFTEITTDLTRNFLPDNVTLDWVLGMLHVKLKLDASEVVYALWSANVANQVPKLYQVGIFTLLMFSFLAIAWSIVRRNSQGFVFVVASLVGVVIFLILWVGFVANFSVLFPDGDNKILMNLTFVGVTLVLFAICFYGIPVSSLFWVSSGGQHQVTVEAPSSEPKIEGSKERSIDPNMLASILGGFVGSRMGNQQEAEPLYADDYNKPKREQQRFLPDPDVFDGEYREINDDQPPPGPSPTSNGPSEPVIIMGSGSVYSSAPSSPLESEDTSPSKVVSDEEPGALVNHFQKPKAVSKQVSASEVSRVSGDPVIGVPLSESAKASVDNNHTPKASKPVSNQEPEIPVIIIEADTTRYSTPETEAKENPVVSTPKKHSPLTATKVAATADVVTSLSTALGQPQVALAAQIVGTASSSYAAAKEAKTKRKNDDPVIT